MIIIQDAIESPFVQFCTKMDKAAMSNNHGLEWYYKSCYELQEADPDYITNLLIEDFQFRAKFGLNVIASAEGEQGTAGKSLFFAFWSYKLGQIFGEPFKMEKNLYAIPEELDHGLRDSTFRTTHFLDEQRNKNVGVGASSIDLSLQDYEEQCRYTQKNILYASPKVKDHSHYFIFKAQNIERYINYNYCANCLPVDQKECYKEKFNTSCPPTFRYMNGNQNIPFYLRSGYPKWFIFLLKTKRKVDDWEVPRGFVRVPMITPETALLYDSIKQKNIKKLETQSDDSFKYIEDAIENFLKNCEKKLIKLTGRISWRVFKLQDDEGNPKLHREKLDTRKYSVVSNKVIEAYLYNFFQSRRKYTVREIDIMISVIKDKLNDKAFKLNKQFFTEKAMEEF